MVSCKKDNQNTEMNQTQQSSENHIYTLNTEESSVNWRTYRVFNAQNTSHFGTLSFSEGKIEKNDGKISSLKLIINSNSLVISDIENENSAKEIQERVLSDQFLNASQFPNAILEITEVKESAEGDYNSILEGNLTLKGITKPIVLNANVKIQPEQISIHTEPTDINRKDFGIAFQYPAEKGVLKDDVTLQISVIAKR